MPHVFIAVNHTPATSIEVDKCAFHLSVVNEMLTVESLPSVICVRCQRSRGVNEYSPQINEYYELFLQRINIQQLLSLFNSLDMLASYILYFPSRSTALMLRVTIGFFRFLILVHILRGRHVYTNDDVIIIILDMEL